MAFTLRHWARLHTIDAAALRTRWTTNPDKEFKEDLIDPSRYDLATGVWTVKSELEMTRLIGALQWQNPRMKLWFRGEDKYFPGAPPKRMRLTKTESTVTVQGVRWINAQAKFDRAIRDRSPMARAAILQHYGCPTSLLDVSASYDIGCAFAFSKKNGGDPHLRIYALPRHQQAVTVFDDVDTVLVDLHAELPSYCMRPHVQQAAFIARRLDIYNDIQCLERTLPRRAGVDALCLAHLRLDFDGAERFYNSRVATGVLYPKAGTGCRVCRKPADMNGDFLLHLLECLAGKYRNDKPEKFPDRLSAS